MAKDIWPNEDTPGRKKESPASRWGTTITLLTGLIGLATALVELVRAFN